MTDTTTNPRLFSRDPAERRAFREELGAGIGRFIPPELRSRFQFLAEMTPYAAVERAGSAARSAVQPGLTAGERIGRVGTTLSEMAGVAAPFAVATRAALPVADAAQEALLGFSVPARAAAETAFERLNQPGPMPETLYSNPRFEEMIAALGRGARADRERVPREALEANDAIRADIGLPPLNPVPRPADPVPEDFGFYQDNPALTRSSGVEWLEHKQRVAEDTYGERRGITGSTTATLGSGDKDMFLPTDFMRRIPGLLDERRVPGEVQYDALLRDVRERGFLPDQDGNRIVLGINHRGEPFIIEGNTRTAVASDLGIPNVRVEVRYKNGGEMVEGPFSPDNIARIAARGPEQVTFQSSARGAAVRPQVGEPFDDWIDRIYAPENRGPGNQVQDPNVVFRAMSPEEASFGETEGVFRDVSGAPLYVANDPERYVGGGAYGGRNRGRIYEFDVTDIPGETRAGGVGITERAVSEIPAERVRRVWEWDPDRRAHVLIEDRTGAPRPENFAQGGPVRGGIGGLSDVARGMFRA